MSSPVVVNYDNVYVVRCLLCRKSVKIVNPKTLHRPDCPTCGASCKLPNERYSDHIYKFMGYVA